MAWDGRDGKTSTLHKKCGRGCSASCHTAWQTQIWDLGFKMKGVVHSRLLSGSQSIPANLCEDCRLAV